MTSFPSMGIASRVLEVPVWKKKRVLIFGGSGFIGGAVARAALKKGVDVLCACRTPPAAATDPNLAETAWEKNCKWISVDALDRRAVYDVVETHSDVDAVISTIGLLTLNHGLAKQINGDANVNIAAALYECKDEPKPRFVYVSASPMTPVPLILKGYYHGKNATERAMFETLGDRGVILQPGMVYGTRETKGGYSVPLSPIGVPLEFLFRPIYRKTGLTLFTPAIHVDVVARAALQGGLTAIKREREAPAPKKSEQAADAAVMTAEEEAAAAAEAAEAEAQAAAMAAAARAVMPLGPKFEGLPKELPLVCDYDAMQWLAAGWKSVSL
jgi:nucleoside-diphosphate-sugar epimerase